MALSARDLILPNPSTGNPVTDDAFNKINRVLAQLVPGTGATGPTGVTGATGATGSGVTRRYDNSAARLWYKCNEASGAANLANSGAAGALNLAVTSLTTGVNSFFNDNAVYAVDTGSIRFAKAASNAEAPALAGGTIWAWFIPGQINATYHRLFGRTNDASNAILDLYLGPSGAPEVQWWPSGAGANSGLPAPIGGLTGSGYPCLVAATYNNTAGGLIKLYSNGSMIASASFSGITLDVNRAANPRWQLGARPDNATPPRGLILDCGYDNTIYSDATINAMWRNGWGIV